MTDDLHALIESIRESADYVRVTGDSDEVIGAASNIIADCRALETLLSGRPAPTEAPTPKLKMSEIRVGMRLREARRTFYPLMTVTEITPRGFKYVLDAPYSLGSRFGVETGGEHFGHDGDCLYERADSIPPQEQP